MSFSSEGALRKSDVSRPRIALIAASLDIVGGQGIQARDLVQNLRHDGYDVCFIPINPRFPTALRWIRAVPYARTLVNQVLYLASLLRMCRADVAHIFSASYWSFLLAPVPAMLASRLAGMRVVLHYHSGEADDHLRRWGPLVHPWLRLPHEIVVPSSYLHEVFARHGYRVHVIRNVVDTSHFLFRWRLPLRPRVLSTRNLEPYYRVDTILRAFALLKKRHPDATLTVAGHGSEERALRLLSHTLGIQPRFVGRVEPGDMPRLYEAADVFLNASTIDNQPVSILEAFASGLPVISTATGDIAKMILDGETGLVVPSDDPAAMAKAAADLLDEPERALSIALRAQREVLSYTWPSVRDAWAAVYAASAA